MSTVDYKDLGAKVRQARKKLGMTQESLAEAIGVSASFVGHIERGTRVASLDTVVTLCNVLHVTPMYLLSASLIDCGTITTEGISPKERAQLSKLLHLAQDALGNWHD